MTSPRPITHGTPSGATLHRRRGEHSCGPCREAERLYKNGLTARRRAEREAATPPRPGLPERMSALAACDGTPVERWVPDEREEVTDWHRSHCHGCPVRQACLAWATGRGEWGIWAATTRDERRQLKRRAQRRDHMRKAREAS